MNAGRHTYIEETDFCTFLYIVCNPEMNRRLCAKSGSPDLTLVSVPKPTFPSFKFLEHGPTFHTCAQNKNNWNKHMNTVQQVLCSSRSLFLLG